MSGVSHYTLCINAIGVLGVVTVKPVNVTAYVGDDVTMSCNTTAHRAVDWRRKPLLANWFEIFCFRGHIKVGYEDKFSIMNPRTGVYVVTVKNVQRNDSGEYRCIEGVGDDPDYDTVVLTVRGNSSYFVLRMCLQCFDAVGWATGRASGL